MTQTSNTPLRPRVKRFVLFIAGVVPVILFFVWLGSGSNAPKEEEQALFETKRGPLTISLSISGTIQPTEQVIIKSEVEGQAQLLYVIEEGARVKEGQLLAELDGSGLNDSLADQNIRVKNGEADFIRARESLAVTRNRTESDISLAALDARFAKEDLKQYTKGTYKRDLMSAESKITIAEEELQLAQKRLEWSEKLFKENYISQSERDSDRLACQRAELDLKLAREDLEILKTFTYKREVTRLESDILQKDKALERVKLKSSADIIQAKADLHAAESALEQQKEKAKKLKEQIELTKIYAPQAGMVVYATSTRHRRRGRNEPLEAGQTVNERQELIHLPTADEVKVVVDIHETDLGMVRLGLPVVITVDSMREKRFFGKITKIAPLPNATSRWLNPDLTVYRTEILVTGRHPELRTGVNCMAEVIIDRYDDARYVPVQAVVRVNDESVVYVPGEESPEKKKVVTGLDNNRMIRILEGLKEGEAVLLSPPLEETAVPDEASANGVSEEKMKEMASTARNTPKEKKRDAAPTRKPPEKEERTPVSRTPKEPE